MISGTITDASGRTLSGQTVEAFWNSVRHAAAGCGRAQLRARRQAAAALHRGARRASPMWRSVRYPNAGLPNAFGEYDEQACETAAADARVRRAKGWSTSSAAAAAPPRSTSPTSARRSRGCRRGVPPKLAPRCRLSGLEPLDIGPESLFVNVGERTNVTGSAQVPPADRGRRLQRRARRGAQRRSPAARRSSTSTWTRACSIRKRRWCAS